MLKKITKEQCQHLTEYQQKHLLELKQKLRSYLVEHHVCG